jgi:NADP-dependent 3-hydroxy acid dehydrogenase YdfG
MASRRGIFVVAGVGNGTGTGAASATVFAKAGYKVALIARNADHLSKVVDGLKAPGYDVCA